MEPTYRLVVGVDGSEAGQQALNWAVGEADRRSRAGMGTSVQAVTAWQSEPDYEPEGMVVRLPDPRGAAEQVLTQATTVARTSHPAVAIAGEVVEGPAAEVLVRAADDADLLVVGSHGYSPRYHAVLGSVAEACVRTSTRPIVIIPMALSAPTSTAGEALVNAS